MTLLPSLLAPLRPENDDAAEAEPVSSTPKCLDETPLRSGASTPDSRGTPLGLARGLVRAESKPVPMPDRETPLGMADRGLDMAESNPMLPPDMEAPLARRGLPDTT